MVSEDHKMVEVAGVEPASYKVVTTISTRLASVIIVRVEDPGERTRTFCFATACRALANHPSLQRPPGSASIVQVTVWLLDQSFVGHNCIGQHCVRIAHDRRGGRQEAVNVFIRINGISIYLFASEF